MKASTEISVPTAALSLPGEGQGQTTAPAPGDMVDISGTAKVLRVEGEMTILQPTSINGQELGAAEAPEDLDRDEDEMQAKAKADEKAQVY
jgi:hypothetical protein